MNEPEQLLGGVFVSICHGKTFFPGKGNFYKNEEFFFFKEKPSLTEGPSFKIKSLLPFEN